MPLDIETGDYDDDQETDHRPGCGRCCSDGCCWLCRAFVGWGSHRRLFQERIIQDGSQEKWDRQDNDQEYGIRWRPLDDHQDDHDHQVRRFVKDQIDDENQVAYMACCCRGDSMSMCRGRHGAAALKSTEIFADLVQSDWMP